MTAEVQDLFDKFLRIIDTINRYEVEYIVIGGVAMISHGMPRLTQDLDLLLKLTKDNVDKLRNALFSIYNDNEIEEITYDELMQYSVIRYGTPDGFYLDIMARIGEESDYYSIKREKKEIEGVTIQLASAESLFKLKKDTVRPEDKRDALFLQKLLEARK